MNGDVVWIGRQALANEFLECRKAIIALGDETRQSIIMKLLQSEKKVGLRVGEITEKTHLPPLQSKRVGIGQWMRNKIPLSAI